MNWFPLPKISRTRTFVRMPDRYRKSIVTPWSCANKRGRPVDCFLEGPCFGSDGSLFVVDIPHGRVFRVSLDGAWSLVVEYDGEPNGLAFHPDGRLLVADYRNGLLALDVTSGTIAPLLPRRNGERFKGLNDLVVAQNGDIYFTDQGQTGLHDPSGRVFRYCADGRLDCLLSNGPSPNGLVLSKGEDILFVAMTRDNSIWRVPLLTDGGTAKVGRFASFHGTSGPDGLTVDAEGHVFVAHASLGGVFVLGPQGEPVARLMSCAGQTTTNVTFDPSGGRLFITESETGTLLLADWPIEGPTAEHRG